MPAWGGRLDPVTIKTLAVYVHSLGAGSEVVSPRRRRLSRAGERRAAPAVVPEQPARGPPTAAPAAQSQGGAAKIAAEPGMTQLDLKRTTITKSTTRVRFTPPRPRFFRKR